MGLPGFGPEFPTPEAGRIPGYPTDPTIAVSRFFKIDLHVLRFTSNIESPFLLNAIESCRILIISYFVNFIFYFKINSTSSNVVIKYVKIYFLSFSA